MKHINSSSWRTPSHFGDELIVFTTSKAHFKSISEEYIRKRGAKVEVKRQQAAAETRNSLICINCRGKRKKTS